MDKIQESETYEEQLFNLTRTGEYYKQQQSAQLEYFSTDKNDASRRQVAVFLNDLIQRQFVIYEINRQIHKLKKNKGKLAPK